MKEGVEIRGKLSSRWDELYLEKISQIIVYNNSDKILADCFPRQQIDFIVEIH